jgi:L-ascorbate metabolism protein UlaG (beta-lactamase superfamily)
MNRRNFIGNLLKSVASAAFFGSQSACASYATNNAAIYSDELNYRPLNGKSMRDLVRRNVHHGNGVFINPFSDIPKGQIGRVLKWKWFSQNHFKLFYADEKVIPVVLDRHRTRDSNGLEITLIKHAGLLIKDVDAAILVDPVFGGLFWFIDDFSPLAFDITALPKPKHILITHGHYDHLDLPSIISWGTGTHVICPPGYAELFNGSGITRRHELDWYHRHYEDGREIIFLPCNHWTMRNPLIGPNTGLWGSYLIRTKSGANLYISGDTAYFDGFEQLGQEFDIDLAIFNLGAYEPRWFMAPSHMNPDETVRAFVELNARHLSIVHWGTFRLGDEPVHFPPSDIRKALRKEALEERYIELTHGQTVPYA